MSCDVLKALAPYNGTRALPDWHAVGAAADAPARCVTEVGGNG